MPQIDIVGTDKKDERKQRGWIYGNKKRRISARKCLKWKALKVSALSYMHHSISS